jgi:peptidoglycan LD-endopeptidase CwlK
VSSRSLSDLLPVFRALVDPWLSACADAELDILVTCTLRSGAEQDALYAKGRTVPGRIVTYARAGQSAHQYGLALDFVIVDSGKLNLAGAELDWSGNDAAWDQAIALAEAHGLQSLRPMESAHVQHPDWKSIAGIA